MEITSSAFELDGNIPKKYTCQGEDISPPLSIRDVPKGAKSLVLIMDDPDAVKPAGRIWNHWIIFDIPPDTLEIKEGHGDSRVHARSAAAEREVPSAAEANEECKKPPGTEGRNTGDKVGYQGPCPPDAMHHYFFRLYALDIPKLNLREGAPRADVEKAVEGHVIEECNLIGVYEKE